MPSVDEYASWRGVSPQRVRELLRTGEIPGRRIGSRYWEVDRAAYGARPRLGRPMSPPIAWALIALMSGREPEEELSQSERSRVRQRLRSLREEPDPAPRLSSWLRRRGERVRFRIQPADLREFLHDPRVVLSGISDPRSNLAPGDAGEVWLRDGDLLDEVASDHLLLSDPNGPLVVHLGRRHLEPVAQIGMVIADLADWNGPREDAQVRRLLHLPS